MYVNWLAIFSFLIFCKKASFPDHDQQPVGDITSEKIEILQEADKIYRLLKSIIYIIKYDRLHIIICKVGGCMGDERTSICISFRAVNSIDGMTAQCLF